MGLPRFIPISTIDGLKFLGEFEDYFRYVILPYYNLITYDPSYIRDLLSIYRFKWILSSIMPDDLLCEDSIIKRFSDLADELDIKDVIVWDMPTYLEYPNESLKNTRYSIETIKWFMKKGYDVIPLAKGAYPEHLRYSIEQILELESDNIAFHTSEYLSTNLSPYPYINDRYITAEDYMIRLIELIKRYPFREILLIGIGSPRVLKIVGEDERFRYASLSWLIHGKDYKAYTYEGIKDLAFRYIECNCPVCSSTPPLIRRGETLPRHNLYILGILTDMIDEGYPDIQLYDLIADYHENILIISGLYVGSGDSRYIDALDLIDRVRPRHLILLGNTFYTGRETSYDAWIDFIDKLKDLAKKNKIIIYPIKGSDEGWMENDVLNFRNVIYPNTSDPIIEKFKDNVDPRYYEYLIKFYRPTRWRLWILKYTYEKRLRIYVYTSRGYDDKSDSREILKLLDDERRFRNVDMAYTNITTYPVLDDKGVGSPGVWIRDLEVDSEIKAGAIYIDEKGQSYTLHL